MARLISGLQQLFTGHKAARAALYLAMAVILSMLVAYGIHLYGDLLAF